MRIRFETTIEDIMAFYHFHYAHSPMWKRQIWRQRLLVPFLVGMFLVVVGLAGNMPPLFWWVVGSLILGMTGVTIILMPQLMNQQLERNVRQLLAEGTNKTWLGWRELELVGNRLLAQTELVESRFDLRAIEKIVGNDNYTFVYIASTQAFTIPMNRWPESEFRSFVGELREAWETYEPRADTCTRTEGDDAITAMPPERRTVSE